MRRIDRRTVELTDEEKSIEQRFEDLLDQGYGIDDAINRLHREGCNPEDSFVEWLRN